MVRVHPREPIGRYSNSTKHPWYNEYRNTEKIKQQLADQYPSKPIIITDPENPTEIMCETKPTQEHPDWSEAIAVVDSIRPHYHKQLTETYEIIKGTLTLYVNDSQKVLNEGDSYTIEPEVVHWAEGNETWFKVYSEPGWTPEDHILVKGTDEISRKEFDKKFN